MKVLVLGSGGREHALAWKLAQSARVQRVYVAPGNAGTAQEPGVVNVPLTDGAELCAWAQHEGIDLTVVGPEAPLAQGVVDRFRAAGLKIVGPVQAAAQLESSKAFSKDFMCRHGIPTAAHATFEDPKKAHAYIDRMGAPIVVKADGLAAGKGVVVAMTLEEAHAAVDAMLGGAVSTAAGSAAVVIEEYLQGEEASFMVLCDGKTVLPLATSQDHKRLRDGDEGPNTGGMGAYSPAPVVTAQIHARIMREVITPTVRGMAQEGVPYTGFLYAGVMIDAQGQVKTLEFNCRLGDPEAQVILMRLKSDAFELLWAAANGTLDQHDVQWDRRSALGVVLASANYPSEPRLGDGIVFVSAEPNEAQKIFHAGTQQSPDAQGRVVTSGGRVLCAAALGEPLRSAQKQAYELVDRIAFEGMQFRRDIGHRALKR